MKTNEGIERLRTLYGVLAGIPDKVIYLDAYCLIDGFEVKSSGRVTMEDIVHTCGSTACALGWAAVYPPFVEAGLHLDKEAYPVLDGSTHSEFDTLLGSEAGALFFGMSNEDAAAVFGPRDCRSEFIEGLALVPDSDPDFASDGDFDVLHPKYSQKRIALHRIRLYLLKVGAITKQRSAELALIEEGL